MDNITNGSNPSLPANPKQIYGEKKPSPTDMPFSAVLGALEAFLDGRLKYGRLNWRSNPVEAMTYIDAAIRHLRLYENGENYARDTTVQNLGAVIACCSILIDAELHGTLIDNRVPSPETCDLLHERGEMMVKRLQDAQRARDEAKLKEDYEQQSKRQALNNLQSDAAITKIVGTENS